MTEIDRNGVVRRRAIALLARFIARYLYNTDWTLVADMCGITELLDRPEHERVRSAQHFGDEDYADAISRFLQAVFDSDEQIGVLLVHTIIQHKSPNDEDLSPAARSELDGILSMLGDQNSDIVSLLRSLQPPVVDEFIQVTGLPDNFYRRLVDEINQLYANQLPFSLLVMVRKLFENLTIDILRKRYGTQQLELYYDTSRRRFHDFSVLLRNLDLHQADFYHAAPDIDRFLIRDINRYRETGNSAAHSIDANLTIEQISADRENINYLVQYLLRILQRVQAD
jgi:hypothetical protein